MLYYTWMCRTEISGIEGSAVCLEDGLDHDDSFRTEES